MADSKSLILITKLLNKHKMVLAHGRRVAGFACAIAGEMKYCGKAVEHIRFAAVVHDIGKTRLPPEIINKTGPLDEKERVLIRQHPEEGYRLLRAVRSDPVVAEVALQHHERLDGSGYPFGLRAEDINPVAKIVAVADVIATMVFPQVYRPALSVNKAREEIAQNCGLLYDPEVVAVSMLLLERKDSVFEASYPDSGEVI
ncbi:MAG: HD domain-containing protein [Candidatus Omnitrophica bacterium]|nr:HD domain-containing protein [Candidatus Omnitrophota bacterium]